MKYINVTQGPQVKINRDEGVLVVSLTKPLKDHRMVVVANAILDKLREVLTKEEY